MDFKPFKIGRYLLLEKLATGGMAEVYRATAKGAGGFEKQLAIKRILPNYVSNEEFRRMFEYEARLSSMLTHSNIVQIYDFEKSGEDYLLAMEYVNGKNLRQFVNKARKMNIGLPVELSVYILNEVCKGLEYAHAKKDDITGRPLNIIHRDMSPQNIMISYDGAVKIVDFGIAKAKDRVDETRSGVIKGKFSYMSPEQANGAPVDHRSDIFSTTIILWELVTGKRLFASENDLATLKMIQDCIIKKPSTLNPRVPPELDRILLKGLTKDLSLRYESAADLNQDLQRFMAKFFAGFSQRDVGLVLQTVFAAEIEEEKRRVEQLRNQSIPFSQGVTTPKRKPEELDLLEDSLDGTQTKSEAREQSAVTEASEGLNEIGAEEDISISQVADSATSVSAPIEGSSSEATQIESLVEEDPSVPTLDRSTTKSKPQTTTEEKTGTNESSIGGMPVVAKRPRTDTVTPTPTPTNVRVSQPDFLMQPHEFLEQEKKLNRFNQPVDAQQEKPAKENEIAVEDSVSLSIVTSKRQKEANDANRVGAGFELDDKPDYSHERQQYRQAGPKWWVSLLTIVVGVTVALYGYRFLQDGGATALIRKISPDDLDGVPERSTARTEPESTPVRNADSVTGTDQMGDCLLSVDSDPRGAKVWVGGKERGVTSTRILLPCNQAVTYVLELRGFEKVSENIFLKDRQMNLFKSLKRIPTAEIEVVSGSNVAVYVDGELVQEVDANTRAAFDVRGGSKHQIRFKNEVLGIDFSKEVFIEEGKKEVLNVEQLMLRLPPGNRR